MALIAKLTAILIIIVCSIPACSPAFEIKTAKSSALQELKTEEALPSTPTQTEVPLTTPAPTDRPAASSAHSAALNPDDTGTDSPGNRELSGFQADLLWLYERTNHGVVTIISDEIDGVSLSSGFFIDKDGHIAASYHGVKTESDLTVRTSSGETMPAVMVGKDPDSDLAVLKVDMQPESITPLLFGDSDGIQVGQVVAAIGVPFGLQGSMTTGIVSGIGQGLRYLRRTLGEKALFPGDVILTDVAINMGNSGGPLLSLDGRVIGINTTVITAGDGGQLSGMSLALPINVAQPILKALIEEGEFEYPYLGFSSVDELTSHERETLGLGRESGIYVTQIEPDGPAERAGLTAGKTETGIPNLPGGGDLITAVDGKPVERYDQLFVYLIKHKIPGDTVTLSVLRGGQLEELQLELDSRPRTQNQDW